MSATECSQINSARMMPDHEYLGLGAPHLTLKLTKKGEKSNKRRAMEANGEYTNFRRAVKLEVIDSILAEVGQMMGQPLTGKAADRFIMRKVIHRLKKTRDEHNYIKRRTYRLVRRTIVQWDTKTKKNIDEMMDEMAQILWDKEVTKNLFFD